MQVCAGTRQIAGHRSSQLQDNPCAAGSWVHRQTDAAAALLSSAAVQA